MKILLALIFFITPAWADTAAETQVMNALAAVKTAHASFTEKKFMSVLDTPLEDSGTLSYTAPDRLEKQTLAPKPESLVVEGKTLTVTKDGDTHNVDLDDYPEVATFIESIRSTLAGNAAMLNSVYTVAFTGTFDHWQIALTPKDPDMQDVVQAITITGSKGKIAGVETRESDGDRTEMTITEDPPG
jgi:outer membrane lipoprotein-sorting protein